jgi:hypothetical protein
MIADSILGSLLGKLRGLPVTPQIHLTTSSTEGYSFVNDRYMINPRPLTNLFGGSMNIIHYHVLQVKVQQKFREFISSSSEILCSLRVVVSSLTRHLFFLQFEIMCHCNFCMVIHSL